jgi:protein O-mannosyl-transferase
MTRKTAILFLALAGFVTLVYSNHFGNGFHFDDFHTIVQNPYIRNIHNLPRFFVDTETTSVLPANRAWRPLVFASLAIDYRLGNSMTPFYFHLSTFFWFLMQLALMFALFRKVFERARPDAENIWVAAFATTLFAIHPAVAETVNYIIQRADLYSTLGVVASLVIWIYWPGVRRYGLYLLPLAAAVLSKPPAMVFPAILFFYIWLLDGERPMAALRRSIPSLVTVVALAWLSSAMTPASFTPGASSAYAYRITQPMVIFRYFRTFFIPTGLTADTDRVPFGSLFDGDALFGFVFLFALIAAAVWATRRRETRPIAFGLFWFLLAVLPTSVFPLAEVENDHRMFFPFVGLTLSVSWAAALWLYSRPARREIVATVGALVLLAFANGTWQRNKIWRTEESLWYDVTLKSPHNGRGLMNYGLTQMSKGEMARALDYFQRALVYNPNYYILEVNLGIANGALDKDAEAERHFTRAIQLAPTEATSHYYYAVWLRGKNRLSEAVQHLNVTIANNPSYLDAPHLLMDIYAQEQDANSLRRTASDTLARFPSDPAARSWLAGAATLKPTAESYLNQSLTLYQQGRFEESIQAAREALKLRPDYSEAWNNIAAAYNSESRWDEGISAAMEAIRLRPDNQLARNNLAWALQQKQKLKGKGP